MAAAQATVTLKHLAASLLDNHDLPKKQAEAVLGDLVVPATRHLKKGAKVRLTDRSRGRGRRLVAIGPLLGGVSGSITELLFSYPH